MFKKLFAVFSLLLFVAAHSVFAQAVAIDAAVANAAKEISGSVPQGTKVAVLNITSDYVTLSDYVINELIVNLVSAKQFQVVPRSTIELEMASRELDFQMTGSVSEESQKSLGKFLGAGTIISGTVARDAANSYRLTVNAIDLESFTYQSSYRISITNDSQLKALIAGSGGTFYEDYTTGQRLGMAGLNIFGGVGSIINGHKIGWVTTATEGAGIALLVTGLLFNPKSEDYEYGPERLWESRFEKALAVKQGLTTAGIIVISGSIVFGLIIPFFHHKPDTTISQNDFPFKLELASANNCDINGVRVSYNIRF